MLTVKNEQEKVCSIFLEYIQQNQGPDKQDAPLWRENAIIPIEGITTTTATVLTGFTLADVLSDSELTELSQNAEQCLKSPSI